MSVSPSQEKYYDQIDPRAWFNILAALSPRILYASIDLTALFFMLQRTGRLARTSCSRDLSQMFTLIFGHAEARPPLSTEAPSFLVNRGRGTI